MSLAINDGRFTAHFWTQFLGAFNDNLFKNALALLITYQSVALWGLPPESVVALAGGVFILPFFLFSALAGQIADAYEKSRLIRITKWTEFLFMGLAALGFYLDSFSLLMFVLFLMGGQSAIFGPLKYGVVPFLVSSRELTSANALIGAATFVAILLGTILGGFAVARDNAPFVITIMVLAFSALGIGLSLLIPKVESQNSSIHPDWTVVRPIGHLVCKVFYFPHILSAILVVSWFWFLGAAVLSIIPPLAKDVLYGDESVGTFFLATFTIGMGVGAFIAQRFSRRRAQTGMVAPAAFFMALTLLFLGYFAGQWGHHPFVLFDLRAFLSLPAAWPIILSLFLMSIFGGMYIIPMMTYIQESAPRSELSQFIATNNIFNSFMMVLAAVSVMGLYALGLSVYEVLIVLGFLTFVISFIVYVYYSEVTLHFWAKVLVRIFYRVEYRGEENIPLDGPIIFAANHVSYVDWIFLMAASPRPIRFIIDDYFYRLPTAAFWLSQAKLIPITTRKANPDIFAKAQKSIEKSIAEEVALGIFPEGAITRNGHLRRFQSGIGEIVQRHQVPVFPVSLSGLWGSLLSFKNGPPFRGKSFCFRRKIIVTVGAPLRAEDFSVTSLREKIIEITPLP